MGVLRGADASPRLERRRPEHLLPCRWRDPEREIAAVRVDYSSTGDLEDSRERLAVVYAVAVRIPDRAADHHRVSTDGALCCEGNVELEIVRASHTTNARDRNRTSWACEPSDRRGGEGCRIDGCIEGDAHADDMACGVEQRSCASDLRASYVEGEREGVILPVDRATVLILVHRVAVRVIDVGTDRHGITAHSRLGRERDCKLGIVGTGDRRDPRHCDSAARAGERHIRLGKRGDINGMAKRYLSAADGRSDAAKRTGCDDVGAASRA